MDLISPQPFWLLKNGLMGTYPTLKQDLRCNTVILGGGITGALIADALVREGADVVLLEKRDIAGGSTSASTCLLQYEIDTPLNELIESMGKADAERAYWVCHESIDKIERLALELDNRSGFQRKKSVYLASRAGDVKGLKKELTAREKAGFDVEWLGETDISSKFSFQRPGAILSRQAGEIDAFHLAHQLINRASGTGAKIFDRTTMTGFDSTGDGIELKTDRGFRVQAKHLVFATGYESVNYLPEKIVSLNSSFALVSKPLAQFPGWHDRCLLWETARPYFYMRTTADSRALIGGMDDPFRNPPRRDAMVPKKSEKLAGAFRKMFPAIDLEIAYSWAGTFGETKDGLAYIGQVRQMPRCHFACGFGGNGITYSITAAEIISAAILGRPHPDARLFRFDR